MSELEPRTSHRTNCSSTKEATRQRRTATPDLQTPNSKPDVGTLHPARFPDVASCAGAPPGGEHAARGHDGGGDGGRQLRGRPRGHVPGGRRRSDAGFPRAALHGDGLARGGVRGKLPPAEQAVGAVTHQRVQSNRCLGIQLAAQISHCLEPAHFELSCLIIHSSSPPLCDNRKPAKTITESWAGPML